VGKEDITPTLSSNIQKLLEQNTKIWENEEGGDLEEGEKMFCK
jgi:hypothetical protein